MRAGRLKNKIELQQPTATKSNLGQDVLGFATAATVWGAIEPLTGKEIVERDVSIAEISGKVIIRYYSGITSKWRLKFGSIYYEIKSILNKRMENKELTLLIKEIPAGSV